MTATTHTSNGVAFRPLSGPEKVAALLLAMGKPAAGRLLKHFDAAELKQIMRCAADLRPVPALALESLVEEFAGEFSNGVDLLGTAQEAEQLLTGVLAPEQIAELMADILGNSNKSTWERISAVPDGAIAEYLGTEHPQTGALILSKVTSACAAKVIALLPRDLRNDVLRRMLTLKPATDASLRILEGKLHDDLLNKAARKAGAATTARMAEIINKMNPKQMDDVLQSLGEARPKETEALKSLLFSFDDIVRLPPKARMILFDKIPTERVVLALQGTDSEFRDFVLSSLASRARRLVENELSSGTTASQRDILAARRVICDLVLSMAERGEIEIAPADAEDDSF
jgi:flagellar motor switch protein FliG